MGQTERTTKLLLDFSSKQKGGTNLGKRAYLEATSEVLNQARAFYLSFFLAHPEKLFERVQLVNQETGEVREATISSDKLQTWAEYQTVSTREHPDPSPLVNFSAHFPDFPWEYRRSVIKDCIGKAKASYTTHEQWRASGKKKGKPGLPTPRNHPTLYTGVFALQLDQVDVEQSWVSLRVYRGKQWAWVNYPVCENRYFEARMADPDWKPLAPKLVVKQKRVEIHFPQEKTVRVKKIMESKRDPDLVTVAVDLNVKHLAVSTVRQHGKIIETVFTSDQGLDAHRYRHMQRIAKKQWQSGKAVKGERSNQQIWSHVKRMNDSVAHQVARQIVSICQKYPGCVLIFERLRKMKPGAMSKSRRLNRKQANQLKGKIRDRTQEKAYAVGVVSCETNAHGTSQFCSRCGARGERFSRSGTNCTVGRGGKLFRCKVCGYEVQADFNASVNVHHSFWGEFHWHPHKKAPPRICSG
jgi:transposase